MPPSLSGDVRVILLGTGVRPIPPPGYGGIERALAELSQALTQAGASVTVLNEVHPGRLGEYWFADTLPDRRTELEGAVVHASTPVVARRLLRLKIPFVYTTHSRHWFSVSGITQRWGLRLERRAVERSACAIALTSLVRARLLGAFPSGRGPRDMETIGLGVDLDRFAPRFAAGDPQVALGVGALLPVKRWEWAARALEPTGIRLRLIGPATDPAYAHRLAEERGVELLGEVGSDMLRQELERAGFLIHPSAAELFPGVVAQAMAAGRPVIGLPPVSGLVDAGVTGLVVGSLRSTGDSAVPALRAAAVQLSQNEGLRSTMGQAGRAKALRAFDWKVVARAHLEVYRRVAEEGSPKLPAPPPPRKG